MASRSKSDRRSDSGSDSMEAIKPLIVLVLFGTILYGAYSVVQKGPSTPSAQPSSASEAPPFAPPAVEMPQQPLPAAPSQPPAGPTIAPPAAAVAAAVPADHLAAPLAATPPAALPHAAVPAATAAAAAVATAAVVPDAAPARASEGPPTYLAAESARPPAQADVAAASGSGDDRPDRLASAASATLPALPPEMPPPPGSLPSSAAFATAWANAHDNLASGRYAEALTSLSVWYDDRSLSLEESQRLQDLLGQLAGTVIYSQQDLMLPPYVVAPRETLPAIAASLGVSWRLLAKINGIADPMQLVPGEHLKVVKGPFDAVVNVTHGRLSLQLGGAYAGSFPVVVGREFLPRVGSSLSVAEPRPTTVGQTIVLADGLAIQAADDLSLLSEDTAPTSLVVSARDFADLVDILGPGSRVLVRQ